MIFLRLAFNAGLLLLVYYIGRELGRTEPLRREMREHRERRRGGRPDDAAGEAAGQAPAGGADDTAPDVRNPGGNPR